MELGAIQTVNNQAALRFELRVGEHLAKIDYKIGKSGNLYMIHTEVPNALKNQGVGNKLVVEALEWVAANDVKIVPSCPFVKAYIQRNKEKYEPLLADGVTL